MIKIVNVVPDKKAVITLNKIIEQKEKRRKEIISKVRKAIR